jgi:CRISPR-associated protein Cas5d
MTIHLRTWGELACFTRPEMKVERVSYPVITPSAARGLLESILYKPQFRWRVRRVAVKRVIRFLSFRRNEVKKTLPEASAKRWMHGAPVEPFFAEDEHTPRNTLALQDVEYVIEASLHLTPLANLPRRKPPCEDEPDGEDSLVKYLAMFQRRAEKGQCFAQPCFGCREFPAHFELAAESAMRVEPNPNVDTDLGLMLYDVFNLDVLRDQKPGKVEAKPQVTLFRAALKGGVLVEEGKTTLPEWSSLKAQLGVAQ